MIRLAPLALVGTALATDFWRRAGDAILRPTREHVIESGGEPVPSAHPMHTTRRKMSEAPLSLELLDEDGAPMTIDRERPATPGEVGEPVAGEALGAARP